MGNACSSREKSGIIPARKARGFEAGKPSQESLQSQSQFGSASYFDISKCDTETQYEESYFGDGNFDCFLVGSKDLRGSTLETSTYSSPKLIRPFFKTSMSRDSVRKAVLTTRWNCWQGLVTMKDKFTTSKPVQSLPVDEKVIGA